MPRPHLDGALQRALVIGLAKSGTTIISRTIFSSISNAVFSMEPKTVAHFEEIAADPNPRVAKILFGHWENRQNLLEGILQGETGFVPDAPSPSSGTQGTMRSAVCFIWYLIW